MVRVRGGVTFPERNQSEHILDYGRKDFIETGTKQHVQDRLEKRGAAIM